jgi:phosphocarrier protein
MSESFRQTVEIVNLKGLHARAAAKFVRLAESFEADIYVEYGGYRVCGTSIMGLLLFAAHKGARLDVIASGPQALEALTALSQLIQEKFNEEA